MTMEFSQAIRERLGSYVYVLKDPRTEAIFYIGGLVREVYKIDSWYKHDNRWAFNGVIAEPEIRNKYLNQSVEKYIKKGSRNPIRYTF